MKTTLVTLFAALALVACDREGPAGSNETQAAPDSAQEAAAAPAVLARVNGAPITALDLEVKLQSDNHEAAISPDRKKAALDTVILREVLAQKALAQGLDQDPKYQEALRKMEAQLAAFKRQELSELLLQHESRRRSALTDEDARAYFEKNERRIRTKVHVLQILRRSEAAIVEARSAIERGASFEEEAKSLFPDLPEGQTPWDLGYLSFSKVPEPWRETIYDMKAGEMSGVIRGPSGRFWLIKLVDAREDPSVTFESVKAAVLADMKANKLQHSREALERELRSDARVELLAPP